MAIFNPAVAPTQDPEWLRLSRPIETPEANKSTGTLLAGAADVIGESAKAADFITKSTIEDGIHAAVDRERDNYTASLKSADGSVRASSATTSLLDTGADTAEAPSTPNWASTLSSSVGTLGAARANGKISETAYYGRLDSLAKDFRARYPGYRDYVDQEISKTTGVDPANAQIKSMIGDINSLAAQNSAQANKFDTFAQSKLGIPGVYGAWQAAKSGTGSQQDVYKTVAAWETTESQFKMNHAINEDYKGDTERQGTMAEKATTEMYASVAAQSLSNIRIQTPNGPMTLGEYSAARADPASGVPAPTATQAQAISESIAAATAATREHMLALSRQVPKGATSSFESQMGPGGAEKNVKLVNAALENHAFYQSMFDDDKHGIVTATSNLSKNRGSEMMSQLEMGPGGDKVRILRGAVQAGGKDFADSLNTAIIRSSLSDPDKDAMIAAAAKLVAQPNLVQGSTGTPISGAGVGYVQPDKVFTLDKAMKAAQYAVDPGKTRNMVLTIPAQVSDPKLTDQGKTNITLSTYVGNTFSKVINSIPMDYFNKNGKEVPGKFAAFNTIVSPQNVDITWQLGQKDKSIWDTYRNGVEEAFVNQLAIPTFKELTSIQTNPNVGVQFNDKTMEFNFKVNNNVLRSRYDKTGAEGFFSQTERDQAVTMLNRFNSGIKSMSAVYAKEGIDPKVKIYEMLQNTGMNDKPGAPLTMSDVIDKMRKALSFTNKPKAETP